MITFHENFHIRICTTAAESPWCNGLFEQHNAVLGLMVTKTITNTNCDLDTAAAWAVSTKNSLTNKNGFSPNQLVFSKNSNYPTIETDLPPTIENKMSNELVQENLNSQHSAQKKFIKAESSEKLK